MNRQQRPGYVLTLVLIIMGVLVSIATYMYYRSSAYTSYASLVINREKAKMLANSGVQVAIAQLTAAQPKKDKKPVPAPAAQPVPGQPAPQPQQPIDDNDKKLLAALVPLLNRWQEISFEQASDKVEAKVSVYVACENGKINLNEFLAYVFQPIKGLVPMEREPRPFFDLLAKRLGLAQNVLPDIKQWWTKRKGVWANDATELLQLKAFEVWQPWVFMPAPAGATVATSKEKAGPPRVYLTDLFTVWTEPATLSPWVLSRSLVTFMTGTGLAVSDRQVRAQKDIDSLLRGFKASMNWKAEWDQVIKPLYGVSFGQVPPLLSQLLSPRFKPTTFAITSYARVADVTQGVYAIVRATKGADETETFTIIRAYWLR